MKYILRLILGFYFLIFSFFNFAYALSQNNVSLTQLSQNIQKQLLTNVKLNLKVNCDAAKSRCILSANGTGAIFEKTTGNKAFLSLAKNISNTLQTHGWFSSKLTKQYSADAPFSTVYALQTKNNLLIISIKVSGDTSACPKDQPIDLFSNCHLTPNKRNYTVKLYALNISG